MRAAHPARRLLLAAIVGACVGPSILACSGASPPGGEDGAPPAPEPSPAPADPGSRLVGSWRVVPTEERLRELKIIDAAITGKPQKKERLGKLTEAEEKLFREWGAKKGAEVERMKGELRFAKSCTFEFTDTQVRIRFGDEQPTAPIIYTLISATDANTTLKFDPGFGNGMETHSIDWDSPTRGLDHITTAAGRALPPLNFRRR